MEDRTIDCEHTMTRATLGTEDRDATGSGLTDWKPAGWHQVHNLSVSMTMQ